MFEQLIRPFQSRQIGTTRRLVPIKVDDTPDGATITWGSTGNLPQGVAQPKGVNLENIESVGFNLRGNIDNFHQTSRESEQVDVPIRDNSGTQIGTATIDRAKEITYANKNGQRLLPQGNFGYTSPNFTGVGYVVPTPMEEVPGFFDPGKAYMPNFTGVATVNPPPGLRKDVPSNNTSQRTDRYTY